MTFKNQDEAWQYWLDMYEYEGKYEGIGRSFDDQVDMFKDWLEYEAVGWPDEKKPNLNLQD